MFALLALLPKWLDPVDIIQNHGTLSSWIIVGIIFAECGLLIGFFLPGDSLLFLAGFFSAKGTADGLWPWYVLLPVLFVAAFLGSECGFLIGKRIGPSLFHRKDSRFFKQSYVSKAHDYFEARGQAAIVIGRFVPVVRTFLPVVVGVVGYERHKFSIANALGALIWAVGVTTLGLALGNVLDKAINVDKYIYPVTAVVVLISFIPVLLEVRRSRRHQQLS